MHVIRSKFPRLLMVFVSLATLVSIALASQPAPGEASLNCNSSLSQTDANAAMLRLKGVFQLVDTAFDSSPTGLDPNYIATLGYYVDQTQVIAHGPFQQVGPQLGPGSSASWGITESSQLQAFFEGGLKAAYGPQTTLSHWLPVVSTLWAANRRVTVNSRADVFDNSQPPRLVAVVRGLGQWYIPCDATVVPQIDWIHFTLQVLIPAPTP